MIRTAEALGQTEVVELLEENLADEKDTLKEVEKIGAQLTRETAST